MELSRNVRIHCPYCGEPIEVTVDCAAGRQDYIEDCQVCCKPIALRIAIDEDGEPSVEPRCEDE